MNLHKIILHSENFKNANLTLYNVQINYTASIKKNNAAYIKVADWLDQSIQETN